MTPNTIHTFHPCITNSKTKIERMSPKFWLTTSHHLGEWKISFNLRKKVEYCWCWGVVSHPNFPIVGAVTSVYYSAFFVPCLLICPCFKNCDGMFQCAIDFTVRMRKRCVHAILTVHFPGSPNRPINNSPRCAGCCFSCIQRCWRLAASTSGPYAGFGQSLLHTMSCLVPFLEHSLIDSLPYLVASSLTTFPVSLHRDIVNTLCHYLLPFTLSKWVTGVIHCECAVICWYTYWLSSVEYWARKNQC